MRGSVFAQASRKAQSTTNLILDVSKKKCVTQNVQASFTSGLLSGFTLHTSFRISLTKVFWW